MLDNSERISPNINVLTLTEFRTLSGLLNYQGCDPFPFGQGCEPSAGSQPLPRDANGRGTRGLQPWKPGRVIYPTFPNSLSAK